MYVGGGGQEEGGGGGADRSINLDSTDLRESCRASVSSNFFLILSNALDSRGRPDME